MTRYAPIVYQLNLADFGYGEPSLARVCRRHGHWVIFTPTAFWYDSIDGQEQVPGTDVTEGDVFHTFVAALRRLEGGLQWRLDRHAGITATGAVVLRLEAVTDLRRERPAVRPAVRNWMAAAETLLRQLHRDPTLVYGTEVMPTWRQRRRDQIEARRKVARGAGTHFQGDRVGPPLKPRRGIWTAEEDRTLVRWLSPRMDGTRQRLSPEMTQAMMAELPRRTIKAVHTRVARLNTLLRVGACQNPPTAPDAFLEAQAAIKAGMVGGTVFYLRRYSLGACLKSRGIYTPKAKGKTKGDAQTVSNLQRQIAALEARLKVLEGP